MQLEIQILIDPDFFFNTQSTIPCFVPFCFYNIFLFWSALLPWEISIYFLLDKFTVMFHRVLLLTPALSLLLSITSFKISTLSVPMAITILYVLFFLLSFDRQHLLTRASTVTPIEIPRNTKPVIFSCLLMEVEMTGGLKRVKTQFLHQSTKHNFPYNYPIFTSTQLLTYKISSACPSRRISIGNFIP